MQKDRKIKKKRNPGRKMSWDRGTKSVGHKLPYQIWFNLKQHSFLEQNQIYYYNVQKVVFSRKDKHILFDFSCHSVALDFSLLG